MLRICQLLGIRPSGRRERAHTRDRKLRKRRVIAASHEAVVCEPLHRRYRAALAFISAFESERHHRHVVQPLKSVSDKRGHQIVVKRPELRSVLAIPHDRDGLAEVAIYRPDRRERRERKRKAEPIARGVNITSSEGVDVM